MDDHLLDIYIYLYYKLINFHQCKIKLMPKSARSNTSSTIERITNSNIDRMQEQTDKYTQRYEWERRNLVTVEGVLANLEKELNKTNTSVAKLKKECEQGQMKLVFTKMRNLQKQIDIYDKRYNETLGELDRQKAQIDKLREERHLLRGNIKGLEDEISEAEAKREKIYVDIENDHNISKTSQNIMLNLKLKHENDKIEYYRQIGELNAQLRDQQLKLGPRVRSPDINAVSNDTATVLKRRLTKLIVNNKERVKLIDNYQRNMKIIDEAFNTIKQATGLTDIEEIQNTFIKSEEQNYGLLTYVDLLNQQIDTLKDSNESLKTKNQALKIDNAEKHRILNGTPDDQKQKRKIEKLIKVKQEDITKFEKFLVYLQPKLQEVLIAFAKSKLNKDNTKLLDYEGNGITLNDSSLDQYLSELEDYTNQLIIYKLKEGKESTSDIVAKTLLIEQLPNKDFKKKAIDNQALNAANEEGGDYTRQLLDKKKLDEIANKEIEKVRNAPEKIKKK